MITKRYAQLIVFGIAIVLAVLLMISLSVDLLPPPPQPPTSTAVNGFLAPGNPSNGPLG